MEERLPPQNLDAEQSVLGAILISNDALAQVIDVLGVDDFYREAHRVIFQSMLDVSNNGDPIDLITVTDMLSKNGKLEDIGGLPYITSLSNAVSTAANVKYHAGIVAEKSTLRQMIRVATEIAAMGYEGEDETNVLLDKAEKSILSISSNKKKKDFEPISSIVVEMTTNIDKLLSNSGRPTGIASGFVDLDKLTSGLHPSDFVILAARPSMGKTAFALNVVQNVALRSKSLKEGQDSCCVAFFSLEMSKEQLVNRIICAEAGIDSQKMRVGELNDEDLEKFWNACDQLSRAKIYIDDTAGITAMDMRSRARRLKAEHGLDLIVVDYLQLMQGSGKRNSSGDRQQEVSEISRSLKALARELDVPVIALSQLSRSVEARQVKRPMLSDLRESGSLEQDADIVAFLYREDYYNPETENKHTELIIAKHRNGPVGTVNLFFHKGYTKFVGLSDRKDG